MIAVPEEAVFLDGSDRYVFIREGDGRFVARESPSALHRAARSKSRRGLKEGDAVVTKGVFTLKSELKKETLHADEH